MSNALERRRREQAVIAAAQRVVSPRTVGDALGWQAALGDLRQAVESHRALELGPTDGVKSRGVECTSEMAAAFMHGRKAEELSGKILRRLMMGRHTVDELVVALDRPHQSVSARVNELRDNGWIEDSGVTRLTRSGLNAIVWILSPKAYVHLRNADRETYVDPT